MTSQNSFFLIHYLNIGHYTGLLLGPYSCDWYHTFTYQPRRRHYFRRLREVLLVAYICKESRGGQHVLQSVNVCQHIYGVCEHMDICFPFILIQFLVPI